MKTPFTLTRVGLASRRFASQRADWYEYLSDMIQDSDGRRTIRDILAADAARYGSRTARGILSAHWASRIEETGHMGEAMAGTLPQREVGTLAGMQAMGQSVFVEGLRDLAGLVRLTDTLRSVLVSTLFVALIATAIMLVMLMVAVPLYTAPTIRDAFPDLDPAYFGTAAATFFGLSDWLREYNVTLWLVLAIIAALFAASFAWWDGSLRRRFDAWGPYRLYRDIQAIGVVSTAATAVKTRAGQAVPLRAALHMQRTGASRWLDNRITAIIARLEDSRAGAAIFDVGLLPRDVYWYLEDLTHSLGLDVALQKTKARLETRMLAHVRTRATALRWALLLVSVITMLGLVVWHYAVIFDLRNATMLSAY